VNFLFDECSWAAEKLDSGRRTVLIF